MEGVGARIDDDESLEETQADAPADAGVDGGDVTPRVGDAWLSNEAVTALLQDRTYRGAGFRRVDRQPFGSTVAPGKTIALYVSEGGYEGLRKIVPERTGSKVVLPPGTLIVREVLNKDVLETITVMMRLPNGSFPLGGDWWYGASDAAGKIKVDAELGTPQIGLLERCGTCHLRRPDDDHVFGAPASAL